MTIGIVAYLTVVGAGIAIAAWFFESGLRVLNLPGRWPWIGAIVLLLGAMIVAPRAGTLPESANVSVSTEPLHGGVGRSVGVGDPTGLWGTIRTSAASAPPRMAAGLDAVLPGWADFAVTLAWLTTSGVLLAILAIVHLRYRRRMTRWPTMRLHNRDIHVGDHGGPAVIGLWRPAIVIPSSLLDAGTAELSVVLAHEEEHLLARDNWLLALGCVAAALIPWHPASWWMLARLRLAVEVDCDRRVLRRGIERRLYGETLIDLGARCRGLPLGVAALAEHSTHLERRLVAMTATSPRFPRSRAATLVAISALIVAAACEARVPTSPEIERMDVAAAVSSPLAMVALPSDVTPAYEIDGKPASADDARAISAARTASIEIVRGERDGKAPTIKIATREFPGAVSLPTSDDSTGGATLQLGPTTIELEKTESTAVLGMARLVRFEGLVLIDGVRSNTSALSRINPESIASIEVLKGSAAAALYSEPQAAKGVIHVRLKPMSGAP